MEPSEMGRVLVSVLVENLGDIWDVTKGRIPVDRARRIEIPEALVDTGSTTLALPTSMIRQLGLQKSYEKTAITSVGKRSIAVYDAVRLTVMDRFCTVDVMEVPDDVPALIGQIPLEMLDLVVDARNRKLTGNPAHNGEHVLELL
jgi:predicted aspartyl protease